MGRPTHLRQSDANAGGNATAIVAPRRLLPCAELPTLERCANHLCIVPPSKLPPAAGANAIARGFQCVGVSPAAGVAS